MLKLYYWYVQSHLSEALLVLDEHGVIYYLSLGKWNSLVDVAKKDFRRVRGVELLPGKQETKSKDIETVIKQVQLLLEDPGNIHSRENLQLKYIFGTKPQQNVWKLLVDEVGIGQTITYTEIAQRLGRKGAARQIGQACGANRIAVLVPCHRVVSVSMGLTGYRWGLSLKSCLLSLEKHAGQT